MKELLAAPLGAIWIRPLDYRSTATEGGLNDDGHTRREVYHRQTERDLFIAEHIRKFWDPRMRKMIFAYLDAGGAGLNPNFRKAIESLQQVAENS